MYNLLTGEDLFTITADTDSVSIIGHLAQMVAYSGNAFSEGFLKSCKRHEEYFAASGRSFDSCYLTSGWTHHFWHT